MGSRISMESRTRRGRIERNENSLSLAPGKMKNTFHAVINIVDSGEG